MVGEASGKAVETVEAVFSYKVKTRGNETGGQRNMKPGNSPSGGLQRYIEDFINRYQQGPQAISEQEAADRYREVTPNFPPRTTCEQPRRPSPACRPKNAQSSV